MKVYVLDISSYDARGGSSTVYSTLERAKAAVSEKVEWTQDDETSWSGEYPGASSVSDGWTIDLQEVDP